MITGNKLGILEGARGPKQNSGVVGPQNRIYALRLGLHPAVKEAVAIALEPYRKLVQDYQSCFLAPALTLARFQAREEMETTLIRWMNRILSNQESFSFAFNNYGSKPGALLYWRIQDGSPFKVLVDSLRVLDGWIQGNGGGPMQLLQFPRLVLMEEIHPLIERKVLMAFSSCCHHLESSATELELFVQEPWTGESRLISRFSLLPTGFKSAENC